MLCVTWYGLAGRRVAPAYTLFPLRISPPHLLLTSFKDLTFAYKKDDSSGHRVDCYALPVMR